MERRFNTENFEKSLKANADEFKMMPSKKVWRGIYNDLHPGTRWPSVAMSLVFIFTLVIIGHLNTNNSSIIAALNAPPDKPLTTQNTHGKKKIKTRNPHLLNNSTDNNNTYPADNNFISDNNSESFMRADQYMLPVLPQNADRDLVNNNVTFADQGSNSADPFTTLNQFSVTKKESDIVANTNFNNAGKENTIQIATNNLIINTSKTTGKAKEINFAPNKKEADSKPEIKSKGKEASSKQEEKTAGTSFLSKKVRDKISLTYYVSPSVSYRYLSEKNIISNSNQNSSASASPGFMNGSVNNDVIHKPIIGFEAGASINYKLSKRWQATAGLQLNYAGYNIKANYVHPTQTSLLLISDFTGEPYAFNSISSYGNGNGSAYVTLHQYSFQASAPLGLKYMLGGNDNLQFNVEASFQPSYTFAGKAYLLSGDRKNYVNEPSLLRSLNMSTNIGTFVSFKSNNFNWQIGPQVFYQMLSTYAHNYPIQEHLVNYGIRFGVSKLKK